MRKLTLLFCALVAGISCAMAQTSISGTVLMAEDDEPVIGASILVKGANASTITDIDGKFTIKIPEGASRTLVITYIGMEKQEVFARNGMVVKLVSSDHALDDVVVVGYRTIRQEAKTGSIATVKGDELTSIPETSVDKMLSGKLAGVSVSTTNGQPGAATSIRVRGTSSLGAGNDPLYVVDGIPIESGSASVASNSVNAIALISPSDIASITVLKDAAAASIYGSRAANGVILITTKSGEAGKSKITLRARYGVSTLANDNNFELATLEEYVQYQRDARYNASAQVAANPGISIYDPSLDINNPASSGYFPEALAAGASTNWMKELTQTGQLQEYEVVASGGAGKTTYHTSLSYNKSEGIVPTVGFEKIQLRVNLDTELNKWIKMGTRINGGYLKQKDTQNGTTSSGGLTMNNPFFTSMVAPPTSLAYNEDGSYNFDIPALLNISPIAALYEQDKYDKQYKFNGTVYLDWKPIKQLTFRTNNSIEYATTSGYDFSPAFNNIDAVGATLYTATLDYRILTTSNTISYNDLFNDAHSLSILVGQEANAFVSNSLAAQSRKVIEERPFHSVGILNENQTVSDGRSETSMVSFFGVGEYSYNGRYYIKGSLRADGSSKFGANNRWGLFWAAAASWNMHNEAFFEPIRDVLNVLKIRYSYGVNGNDNISSYAHYGLYGVGIYNGGVATAPSQLANPNLTWETNKTHNIGIDFRLWDRFSGSIDWYTRRTEDMLMSMPLPYTTGFSSQAQNVGSLRNNGLEVQLDADIITTNDWKWSAGLNFAANRSKVLKLVNDQEYMGTTLRNMVGEKLYTYWLYDYAGVNPQNGIALWRNEEGLLTENPEEARRINAGSPEPLWTGGFNTELSWKGLSLSVQLEARYGNKVINEDRQMLECDGAYGDFNIWKGALNYWKKPGDVNVLPKPIYNNTNRSYQTSTRYLEDGSYLRIKDITLAYSLPARLAKKAFMSGVRVYASALNLYTFHNMNYWDPERGTIGANMVSYPMTRSMVVGVDITF